MNFPFMDWILWRKVNCHNFGLYPCDLVQETNLGILHYPSLEMGCVWVLLLLRIKSTALCYCSVTQGNKSQLTEDSMSDSFIAGIVSHAFRLLTCPVCPVSGLIPSLSMVAISISFTGSWVWDCDSSLSLKLVWTVLCLLEIILQAQFTSVFISPLFSLLSKKKKKILHDSSYFLPQAQTMWAKCSRALTAQLWLSARRVSLTTAPRLPKLPLLQNSYKAQFFKVHKKSLKVIFRRWVYQ